MSLELAQKFATCLDTANYADVADLLAEDCTYHHEEGRYEGRQNIIGIYRQNESQLRKLFAEVTFSSTVEEGSGGAILVHYRDRVRKGHRWHELKSYDTLTVEDSKITHIEHSSIPGEEAAFRAFFNLPEIEL